MNTINDITNVDPQRLSKQERQRMIASCRSFLRQAEASEALSDALAVEQPGFTGFDHLPLSRLRNLFTSLAGNNLDKNLTAVQELDIPTIVTLGLCLSTTKIKRMDRDNWEEVIRQAKTLGSRLRPTIYTHSPLTRAIQESGNSVLGQEFHRQVGVFISSLAPRHYVEWNGAIAFAETVPHGCTFQGLTALALQGVVTVYLPLTTTDDCGVRLTTLFSETLLATLFGYEPEYYEGAVELSALTDQVAPILGEDVFNSVKATTTWESTNQRKTSCVKATVYAGHVIMIDVLVTRNDAVELVNQRINT